MDGFCAFVLDDAAVHPPFRFDETCHELEVSEIRASNHSNEIQKYRIPHTNVEPWLNQSAPYGTGAPANLRLVWVRLDKEMRPWQLGIRKSNIDVVLKKFKIEEAYRYSFTSPGGFAIMPGCQTEDSDALVFSLCMPELFAVVWKHDTRNERSDSLCWADDWISEAMQDVMSQRREWARHPLFLALVACVMLNHLLDRDLTREVKSIAAVENRTRYHGFKHTSVGIARGDYATLSQRMSGCAVLLSGLERIYNVLKEFLDDLSSCSQRYGVSDTRGLQGVNSEVNKCIETLQRRLKMQKIQIDYLSRRVEVQLEVLFNLIAQREAKVSIAVAKDSRTLASASKEDSTAMKSIAAVTIAFLPGTSVAAFFAMPLFEWNAVGDGMVVSKRFWIYWAVTVPLTILTLVIWVVWTWRRAKMHKVSENKANDELWIDVEGEMGGDPK